MSSLDFTTQDLYGHLMDDTSSTRASERYKAETQKGYIYVIHCPVDFYKIGKADDVQHRFSGIQTCCPYTLQLIHTIQCSDVSRAERYLHRHFKRLRVRGEWFELSSHEINWLCSISKWQNDGFIFKPIR